jgi:catechol 2,3-dioxygenase-like lactoylglutathione lyase family enzyme
MRLNQVTVSSTDIPRSVEFYKKLGLVQIVDTDHYARFLCPEGGSTFSVDHVNGPIPPASTGVYFECDDLDARVADLKSAGIRFETEPTDQRWLWREAWLRDPDGNRLCLYYAGDNRVNPPWRIGGPR